MTTNPDNTANTNAEPIGGTSWVLVSYVDANGNTVPALEGVRAAITFNDGRVAGSVGCNRISGPYTSSGGSLTFGPTAMTMMACPEPQMTQEAAVTKAMATVTAYEISGDQLLMKDSAGNAVLTFAKDVSISLTGREWTMTFFNNGRGGLQSAAIGSTVTATFAEDGQVSGTGGCNNYSGSYTVDGDSIAIGSVAATEKACMEQDVMTQEAAYFQALGNVQRYRIEGDRLTLYGEGATRMFEYVTK